ncbi:MAG: hypothetical protein K9I02_06770, partial [Haliscomenobacter sp.]|nr:hypothetical protein [Haliscomenobacter sp.]
ENEDWAYGVSDAAYIAIGMPLSDSDYIDSDEVAEFCQYALSEEDLYLPFITKVLEIALDSQPSIQFVNYEAALVNYFDNYQREYGEIKYKQILKAVLSANKAQKVLLLMDTKHSTPSAVDIIATVMSLTYFLFAKKTTIAIGSVFFLHTWHTNTNLKYQTLDDNELTALFIEVIQRSMKMV